MATLKFKKLGGTINNFWVMFVKPTNRVKLTFVWML